MNGEQNHRFDEQARQLIDAASQERTDYAQVRTQSGDAFAGAIFAGLEQAAAQQLAVQIHLDPGTLTEINSMGGLFMGAHRALEIMDQTND